MNRFNWGFNDQLQIFSVFNLAYIYLFLMICMDRKNFLLIQASVEFYTTCDNLSLLTCMKTLCQLPCYLCFEVFDCCLIFVALLFPSALSNNPWQKKLSHNFSGEVLPNCDLYMYVIVITNCVADFVWVWVLEKVTDKSLLYIK